MPLKASAGRPIISRAGNLCSFDIPSSNRGSSRKSESQFGSIGRCRSNINVEMGTGIFAANGRCSDTGSSGCHKGVGACSTIDFCTWGGSGNGHGFEIQSNSTDFVGAFFHSVGQTGGGRIDWRVAGILNVWAVFGSCGAAGTNGEDATDAKSKEKKIDILGDIQTKLNYLPCSAIPIGCTAFVGTFGSCVTSSVSSRTCWSTRIILKRHHGKQGKN